MTTDTDAKPEPSRFYNEASIAEKDNLFLLQLDTRQARTRAGAPLATPSRALADAVAEEWNAQGKTIEPDTMPMTGLLSTLIELGDKECDKWRARILEFLRTDLVCYRADGPAKLITRQAEVWDAILATLSARGVKLTPTSGIVHVDQPETSLQAAKGFLDSLAPGELLALRIMTELSGSAAIPLCFKFGTLSREAAFDVSRVDEEFQIEAWGRDAEADAATGRRREEFFAAARFMDLLAN